jgi:hypothetical protein
MYSSLQYKLSKLDKYLSEYPSRPPVLVGAGHAVGEREGLGVHHQQLPLLEPAQVQPDDLDRVQETQLPDRITPDSSLRSLILT